MLDGDRPRPGGAEAPAPLSRSVACTVSPLHAEPKMADLCYRPGAAGIPIVIWRCRPRATALTVPRTCPDEPGGFLSGVVLFQLAGGRCPLIYPHRPRRCSTCLAEWPCAAARRSAVQFDPRADGEVLQMSRRSASASTSGRQDPRRPRRRKSHAHPAWRRLAAPTFSVRDRVLDDNNTMRLSSPISSRGGDVLQRDGPA